MAPTPVCVLSDSRQAGRDPLVRQQRQDQKSEVRRLKASLLFDPVTAVAVLADLPLVLRLVVVVVAAETTWKVHVSDVVWIGSKPDAHLGEDVAAVDRLGSLDGFLDVRPP